MLEIDRLTVRYGRLTALRGVSLKMMPGEIVFVTGPNGAGKSTLLKAIAGTVPCAEGTIRLDGVVSHGTSPESIARRGLSMVPEGRHVFTSLTVEENLRVGTGIRSDKSAIAGDLEGVFAEFPMLAERARQPSTSLSGGQQQMVALGRALMSNPKLLLCDEISLGLAPIVIRDIYARLPAIVTEGISLVIVEQDIVQALKVANHVYCLQEGRVALAGEAKTMTREKIAAAYFGV